MPKNTESLGDRMKRYESVSDFSLTRRVPVILRIDGRAFHTFTKNFKRPFSNILMDAIDETARRMMGIQGAVLSYSQSDEISILLQDLAKITTEPWLGYRVQRIASLAASEATAVFNSIINGVTDEPARFDARCFSVPLDEVPNYFLWRAQDWRRNSISMLAREFFSHEQLLKKSCNDLLSMLEGIGHRWQDRTDREKNGMFITRYDQMVDWVRPNYLEICALVDEALYFGVDGEIRCESAAQQEAGLAETEEMETESPTEKLKRLYPWFRAELNKDLISSVAAKFATQSSHK